jgi:hypothetical protein
MIFIREKLKRKRAMEITYRNGRIKPQRLIKRPIQILQIFQIFIGRFPLSSYNSHNLFSEFSIYLWVMT